VLNYNKYKTGVDRSDQMLSYYSFSRKTIKWWKKLFFHLFDLAMVNSCTTNQATKESRWRCSVKKSLKDYSVVPVRKMELKVIITVLLADL
jgi:hypothetical protein